MIEMAEDKFIIDDDKKANWAIKKIKEEEYERDRLLKIVEAEIKSLNNKADEIKLGCHKETAWLKAQLENYFYTVKVHHTKTQATYKLLDGVLAVKKPQQKIKQFDEVKLLEFLKANNPEYIKTKQEIAWGEYKKNLKIVGNTVVDDNGEIVDGLSVELSASEFIIK